MNGRLDYRRLYFTDRRLSPRLRSWGTSPQGRLFYVGPFYYRKGKKS